MHSSKYLESTRDWERLQPGARTWGTSAAGDADRRLRGKQEKEIMKGNRGGERFRPHRAGGLSKNEMVAHGFGAYPTTKVP